MNTLLDSAYSQVADSIKSWLESTTVKLAPSVSVSAISAVATLPNIVYALTAVFTAFQLYFLLRDKWWRERNKK